MSALHGTIQQLLKAPKFPGRDYLIEKLPKWLLKKPEGEVIVSTRFGFKIKIDPNFDLNIENVIYERGVYEQGTVNFVREFLQTDSCFIDVGANIGFLSLVAASKVGKNGKVYSFEPVPSTLKLLRENKTLNNFKQIEISDFALGNHTSTATIYPENNNRGGASIINKRSEKGVEIKLKRLDDLQFNKKIDLLKIDVEGFELEVLKGAKNKIIQNKPAIIVEYSSERENSDETENLYDWINELGIYTIYRLKKGKERKSKLVPIVSKKTDLPQHDNLICIAN